VTVDTRDAKRSLIWDIAPEGRGQAVVVVQVEPGR
jgi:hypothetical protein